MIRRQLAIGRWLCDFFFAVDGYDENAVLSAMMEHGAPHYIARTAWRKMEADLPDEGFTWSNPHRRYSLVVIGPATSGREFVNSFVHELRHLADDIGWYLGIDLRGEPLAYLSGDAAEDLADVVCCLGCDRCRDEI